MTNVYTNGTDDIATVNFSDLAEGDWFYQQPWGLGVKIDGRGFYPAINLHGAGQDSRVRRVTSVSIDYVK